MPAKTPPDLQPRMVALFPGLDDVGGIQQAGRLVAAALADVARRYGWSVDFLSLNDSPQQRTVSVNGESIPFSGFGRAKTRFALSSMARARRRTRIVLAAHPHLAVPAAQMKMLRPQLKTIVISHGVEVWQPLTALRHRAFLKADIFVAPSRYTIDQIVEVQAASRTKVRRLPWPLSPDVLNLASQPQMLRLPKSFPDGLVVLSVTRLASNERYKGVDQLIRAVAQLAPTIPSLHLAVVATGDDLPGHEQLAQELGVADRVRFLTGLSQAETAACYSRCDVFALPSTGEGFGFVFLEAMAFGKPVIGAAAGGVTDIIEHEKSGLLVPPGDVNALARSLEELLTREALRFSLGKAGAESVRSNFRFEVFRSSLEEILRECGLASE
ncbi:MAG: glycosyltransferase family 4 protein [Candidatus Acidiferrales bacterium]